MTTTSSTPHLAVERESQFQAMMALYHPPTSLKKHHKDFLKTAWSIRQGYDGTKLLCSFCHKLKAFDEITVHHNDGYENHNDPDNLSPACWPDNRTEGWMVRRRRKAEASQVERERVLAASIYEPPRAEWNSREGRIGEKMREGFSRWLYDGKAFAAEGTQFYPKTLAKVAVHKVGLIEGKLRSEQSYFRYLEADIIGGLWLIVKDKFGEDMIERTAKPYPFPETVRAQERMKEAPPQKSAAKEGQTV